MGERNDGHPVELVALADALRQRRQAEQRLQREPARGHDQLRAEKLELPAVPERAQVALARRRSAVAASGRGAARIATGHGRAIERRVERVLVQLEPAAERLPRAAAPGQTLLALHDAR